MLTFKCINRVCNVISFTGIVSLYMALSIALLIAIVNGVLSMMPADVFQTLIRLAVYLYILGLALLLFTFIIIMVALAVTLLCRLFESAKRIITKKEIHL